MKAVTKLPTPVSSVKFIKQKAVQSIALSLLAVSVAQANETVDSEDIIVTANRTATTADQTLASVTVITREDIERTQIRSTIDLLRSQANLNIKNSGGARQQSSVFMRGTNSNHTLFLIDGVKVGSASTGLTAFEQIPVDQIERIEVVRGPRSSLYGSEALGGVVQVFTRRGQSGQFNPTFSAGAGSNSTYHGNVGANGTIGNASYSANISYEETDGFDVFKNAESDDDGYENLSYSLTGDYEFTADTSLSFSFLRAENDVDYDDQFGGNSMPFSENLNQVFNLGFESRIHDKWLTELNVGRSLDESENYWGGPGSTPSNTDTERDVASWLNHIDIYRNTLLSLGVDYQNDKLESSSYADTERENYGVFGQVQASVGANAFEASLRFDDNEQFGEETTGSVAWGYSLDNGTRLRASYGTAFVAPSFNFLYGWNGDPNLKPETSETFEVGVEGNIEQFDWTVTWFHTVIEDLIVSNFSNGYSPENISEAKIRGLELGARTTFMEWDLSADLTLLDPQNREAANKGKDLVYRPSQTFSFNADRSFGKFSTGLTFIAENQKYNDSANTDEVAGFGVVDLRFGYAVNDALNVQAKIDNVLDKDYELSKNFAQDDRSYYLTVTYRPKF